MNKERIWKCSVETLGEHLVRIRKKGERDRREKWKLEDMSGRRTGRGRRETARKGVKEGRKKEEGKEGGKTKLKERGKELRDG